MIPASPACAPVEPEVLPGGCFTLTTWPSPFNGASSREHQVPAGLTIREALRHVGWAADDEHTAVFVGGVEFFLKYWDRVRPREGAPVTAVCRPEVEVAVVAIAAFFKGVAASGHPSLS